MDFDISLFDQIPNPTKPRVGMFIDVREKKNLQKIYTLWLFEGQINENQAKAHTMCQSVSRRVVLLRGYKELRSQDVMGLPIIRTAWLCEQIESTLVLDLYPDAGQLLLNISEALCDLQKNDISIPFITPDNIVRVSQGYKLFNLQHAQNGIGISASVDRQIISDHHYMDPEAFKASLSGQNFIMQNYHKTVVYSLGLIMLEVAVQSFGSNVRYNDDTIDQMIKIFAKKYGMELASIVRKMVSFDSKKFDCIGLYDAVLSYQIQTLEPQQQHKETVISLTVSQNIYRSQYEPGPQQSFQFIATQQLQNSSGIKLPEDIKQYFRQIQQLQESEQFQPLETINMQQHHYEESIDTSDYIEQTGFQQLEFMKMFDVLSFLKLIPRINKNQIEQKRMISERLYKCTFNGQEKMIKALKGQPTLQAINMLINITNIQSLNLPGLASYDGYLLEECEDDSQQVQVELVFNQMHCTLEKAITQKMLTEGDKYNIANQLLQIVKQFNQFFVHGGLKPSNVYLSQDLKIQILEYGMFRYNKEDIFINTNVSLYNPPEMSNEGVLNKQSDIWSLGLIIYLMFNGKPISAAQNIMLAQQLNLEMENFRMLNLIKKMVVQDPNKRIQIDEVIKEFSFLQNNNSQKSIQNQQQVQYQNQIIIQNQSQNQNQIQNQIQNQQTVKKHNSPPRVSSRDQSRPYIGNPRQYKQVKNQTSVGFFIQGNGMNLKTPTQNKQKK